MHSAIGKARYESASLLLMSDLTIMQKKSEKKKISGPLFTCSLSTVAVSPLCHTGKLTLDSTNPSDPLTINSPVLPKNQYIPS